MVLETDDIVLMMREKYNFPEEHFVRSHMVKALPIYWAAVGAGTDVTTLTQDMELHDYYLAHVKKNRRASDGKTYDILRFERDEYDDITAQLKAQYRYLLHWTCDYNLKSIYNNGIVPIGSEYVLTHRYPARTFFLKEDLPLSYLDGFGSLLLSRVHDPRNQGYCTLLAIDLHRLPDDVWFFGDPTSENSVITKQTIPPDYITSIQKVHFHFSYADVLVTAESKILILKRYDRFDNVFSGKWCLPGGKVADGEDPALAACRELKEETSIDIVPDQLTHLEDMQFNSFSSTSLYGLPLGHPPDVVLSNEHTQYKWVSKEELRVLDMLPQTKELIFNHL